MKTEKKGWKFGIGTWSTAWRGWGFWRTERVKRLGVEVERGCFGVWPWGNGRTGFVLAKNNHEINNCSNSYFTQNQLG